MIGQNGKKSNRTECCRRAIRLVQMFQTYREVTVRHIMDEFDITKQSAQRWLDEMSRVYPVAELRENKTVPGNNNPVPPQPQKVYGLME
jgi:hypothetical protein